MCAIVFANLTDGSLSMANILVGIFCWCVYMLMSYAKWLHLQLLSGYELLTVVTEPSSGIIWTDMKPVMCNDHGVPKATK